MYAKDLTVVRQQVDTGYQIQIVMELSWNHVCDQ